MLLSLLALLIVGAFVCAVLSAMGKAPLWVAVVLLTLAVAVQFYPLR
jgi:hypothetical protein